MSIDDTENEELQSLVEESGLSEEEILWNSAGMHRPISSFWYNYIFILIAAIPGLLVVGWLIPSVLLPYPSALGIANVVTGYFQLLFTMFDLGTGIALQKFVSEHAAKEPKKALKYLSFFSWFQLITGLIQTSIIAIYVLSAVRVGDEAFLAWPFLIYSLTQYPGMLGVYKNALGAFQRHDKQIIVELFQNMLFQSITQIGFILIGRYLGNLNPIVGDVMGGAIGYIIGGYIDDFLGMVLGAKFFHDVLDPLGYSVIDSIRPSFNKQISKEIIIYGAKVVPAYGINALVNFLVLLMTINWMPNYTTIVAIVGLASGVAMVTSTAFTITPAISEAYNNGYFALTQYYIKSQWFHWSAIAMFLFVAINVAVPPAFRTLAGNYALAADIIPILLIVKYLVFPINFGSSVSQGINKPEYQTYALFFEQTVRALSYFVILHPDWGIVQAVGTEYMLYLYVFADFPAYMTKLITQWFFVKRTIDFSISPPFWKTFIAPALTAIPLYLILQIPMTAFRITLANSGGDLLIPIIILGVSLLLGLFLLPLYVVFPFYGIFGGWDEDALIAFENAATICGPSKFLVKIMAKTSRWGHNHRIFKDLRPLDYAKAREEALELTKIRIKTIIREKKEGNTAEL